MSDFKPANELLKNTNPAEFFGRASEDDKRTDSEAEDKKKGYFAEPNTTQTPNEFFDFYMVGLTDDELRVTLYVIRHTLGYKKEWDRLAIAQFKDGVTNKAGKQVDWGCGIMGKNLDTTISRIKRALNSAAKKGVIEIIDSPEGKKYRANIKKEETIRDGYKEAYKEPEKPKYSIE